MASGKTTLSLQKKSDILKLKLKVKSPLWQAMWLEIMQDCRSTATHTFRTLVLYGREWSDLWSPSKEITQVPSGFETG
jgi:hypothetical protein